MPSPGDASRTRRCAVAYSACMSDIVVGLVAVVAGALLCFAGRIAARVILSVWGAFVGLALGGAAVTLATGAPPLSKSWCSPLTRG